MKKKQKKTQISNNEIVIHKIIEIFNIDDKMARFFQIFMKGKYKH